LPNTAPAERNRIFGIRKKISIRQFQIRQVWALIFIFYRKVTLRLLSPSSQAFSALQPERIIFFPHDFGSFYPFQFFPFFVQFLPFFLGRIGEVSLAPFGIFWLAI
jgi:hypothetical protein